MSEIRYHAGLIEKLGAAVDSDYPVVAMHSAAFALIGQVQTVGRRYFDSFADIVHIAKLRISREQSKKNIFALPSVSN